MSTTERYGTFVWEALVDLTNGDIEGYEVWSSATAVGEKAGVSRETARKYLDEFCKSGHAEYMTMGGMRGYRVSAMARGAQ